MWSLEDDNGFILYSIKLLESGFDNQTYLYFLTSNFACFIRWCGIESCSSTTLGIAGKTSGDGHYFYVHVVECSR